MRIAQEQEKLVRMTTNIRPQLLRFIDARAKAAKTSRRNVIEGLIEMSFKEWKRRKIIEGCNSMADDQDEMREWLHIANNSANLIFPVDVEIA